MRASGIGVALLAFVSLLPSAPRAVADGVDGPSADEVRAARDKGISFLKSRQDAEGSWGAVGGTSMYGGGGKASSAYAYPAGATALSLYALLASGVPKDDPLVKKGFVFLDKQAKASGAPGSSYEASAMILAVTARAPGPLAWHRGDAVKLAADDKKKVQALVDALLAMRISAKTSGWRYNTSFNSKPPGGNQDLSSTGLATLALFAADRCGAKVPADLWSELAAFAMAQQEMTGDERERAVDEAPLEPPSAAAAPGSAPKPPSDAGPAKDRARGFAYIRSEALDPDEGQPTGGMTACGVSILQSARLVLGKKNARGWGAKDQAGVRQSLLDGCAWLDANWSPSTNPRKKQIDTYHVLYLTHLGDAMDLVGSPRLGAHPWFADVARGLLQTQKPDGSWNTGSSHKPADVLDTCFALLFFARPFGAPAPAAGAGK